MAQRPGNRIALAAYPRAGRGMTGKGMAIAGLASSVLGGAFGVYLTSDR